MTDYIIAGGGSAGCVLANRLSEDPGNPVLLLEAGGSDWHPLFHMPAGFAKMTKGIASWGWSTVPQKHMKDRVFRYTQAKVIGGGSSINAQIYTRGNARDYDAWEREEGCAGWSYRDVLPYFKRAENNERYANDYHGYGGPLGVSNPIAPLPICEAFFRAGQELGIPFNPDFNGASQEGVGYYQLTQKNARRSSASVAYLKPVRDRKNLTVRTGVHGDPRRGREGPRGRRRDRRQARRPAEDPARRARSHRHLRRHRLAEAADAVRHRPGRSSEVGRHQAGARPARRRLATCRTISICSSSPNAPATTPTTSTPSCTARPGPACNICCSRRGRWPRACSRPAASGTPTRPPRRPTSSSISASAPASRPASRS